MLGNPNGVEWMKKGYFFPKVAEVLSQQSKCSEKLWFKKTQLKTKEWIQKFQGLKASFWSSLHSKNVKDQEVNFKLISSKFFFNF